MDFRLYYRSMELLGFKIFGLGKITFRCKFKEKEVKPMIVEKTIQDCIINDILQACQEDLENKENNKNVKNIIKDIVNWCYENGRI